MGFLDLTGLQYYDSKIKTYIDDKSNTDDIVNSLVIRKAGMPGTQWYTNNKVYRVEYLGNIPGEWSEGAQFDMAASNARVNQTGYQCSYLECRPGDACYIKAWGANATVMGWGFLSIDGVLLKSSSKSFHGETVLFAPEGAAYVYVNASKASCPDPYIILIPKEQYNRVAYQIDKVSGFARRDADEIKNVVLHGEPDISTAITALYMYGENIQEGTPTPSSPVEIKPTQEGFDTTLTINGGLVGTTDVSIAGSSGYRYFSLTQNVFGTAMGDGGSGTSVSTFLPINIQSNYLAPLNNAMYTKTNGIRVAHDGSAMHINIDDFLVNTSSTTARLNSYLKSMPLTLWYKSENYSNNDPTKYFAGGVYSEDGTYCGFGTTEKITPLYRWDRIDVMTGKLSRYTKTVNLGDLTWELRPSGVFRATVSDITTSRNSVNCTMYKQVDVDEITTEDKSICTNNGYIYINDADYTTAADFNTACGENGALEAGVIYYEATSPTSSEVTIQGIWGVNNARGEMEIMGNGYFEVEYAANAVAMETEMPERCEGAYIANSYVSSSQYENGFMCFTKGRNALVININLTTGQALPANTRVKIGTVGRKPVNETVTNIIGTNGTVAQLIVDAAGNACLFSANGISGTDTYAGTMFVSTL